MKLNVGDYVRTQNHNGFAGGIAKILKIEHDERLKKDWLTLDRALDHISFLEMSSNVIKSSPNIIDLIEFGDYVNGKLVEDIFDKTNYADKSIKLKGSGDYWYNEHIKSIVTKEQFKQMEYKIN